MNHTYTARIRGQFAGRLKIAHASSSQDEKNDDGNLSPQVFLSNEVSSRQIETRFSRPKSRTPNSFILGDPDFPKKAPLLKFKNYRCQKLQARETRSWLKELDHPCLRN